MQSPATSSPSPANVPAPLLPSPRRLHPLLGAAAISVVIASLTAVAAVTGVLPLGNANTAPTPAPLTAQAPMSAAVPDTPAPGSTTRPPAYDAQHGYAQGGPQQQAYPQGTQPYPPATQARTQAQAPVQDREAAPRAPSRPSQRAYDDGRYAAAPSGGAEGSQYHAPLQRPAVRPSHTAGRVVAITPVQTEKPASGLGAVGGAVVGGLLGNQVGKGNGRIVGTVVGAAAGGFAGNEVEKYVRKDTQYQVRVRMDDGTQRTFTYQSAPGVQVGERVRMQNGELIAG